MTLVKDRYGFLPLSVWRAGKIKPLIFHDNSQARSCKRTNNSYLPCYPFSEFNSEVARRIILLWSQRGEVIFDPFSGRGTRATVAYSLEREYIATEVSSITFKEATRVCNQLITSQLNPNPVDKPFASFFLDDGCRPHFYFEDESMDMIFTCPPYWNLERYESCEGQLSDCKSYGEFMKKIAACIRECFRILKQGKFSVWVVADFRRGQYYCFHKDVIDAHLNQGYVLHDIIINVINSPFVALKAEFNDRQKYTGKCHEYILVFRKPDKEAEKDVIKRRDTTI